MQTMKKMTNVTQFWLKSTSCTKELRFGKWIAKHPLWVIRIVRLKKVPKTEVIRKVMHIINKIQSFVTGFLEKNKNMRFVNYAKNDFSYTFFNYLS